MKVEIGFTITDRAAGYVPASDGYRKGAKQRVVTIDLFAVHAGEALAVAEAVFVATNAPAVVVAKSQMARDVLRALVALSRAQGTPSVPRSLSVGDTVTVEGVTVACASAGWKQVTR